MKKLIVANWKMNGTPQSLKDWADKARGRFANLPAGIGAVLCPPAPLLWLASEVLGGSDFQVGAQDCYNEAKGAFTGDISPELLAQMGCTHVIVGHSERRSYHQESNALVAKKAALAVSLGLVPIVCIGETEVERASGQTLAVLSKQIVESLPDGLGEGNFVLAYEPVWAIGSGKLPTLDEISTAHDAIIAAASQRTGLASGQISVLYGGSVKPENARDILALTSVWGVLVGGASLKADDLCDIISAAA